MKSTQDFADVYQQTLPSVWRFVSSRVPDHNEAQDVTSDVFTRAWQSWPRYDPARGAPTAWMCGIAQRAVADWWRKRRPERIEWEQAILLEDEMMAHGEPWMDHSEREPEQVVLRQEFATELKRALLELNARERDSVALRFGAGLSIAEVAAILDLSVGATKMMICRAVKKLRAALAPELATSTLAADERAADLVDEAIADVLAQRPSQLADPLLCRVLQYLAVAQQPAVPPELRERVQACIACQTDSPAKEGGADGHSVRTRIARWVVGVLRAATVPSCILCAAAPVLIAPITALGLFTPALMLHAALVFLAPFNVFLLWRNYRYHRERLGVVLAAVGVLLIFVHLSTHILHIGGGLDHITLSDVLLIGATIWIGGALLFAGSIVDWRARRRLKFRMLQAYAA